MAGRDEYREFCSAYSTDSLFDQAAESIKKAADQGLPTELRLEHAVAALAIILPLVARADYVSELALFS